MNTKVTATILPFRKRKDDLPLAFGVSYRTCPDTEHHIIAVEVPTAFVFERPSPHAWLDSFKAMLEEMISYRTKAPTLVNLKGGAYEVLLTLSKDLSFVDIEFEISCLQEMFATGELLLSFVSDLNDTPS